MAKEESVLASVEIRPLRFRLRVIVIDTVVVETGLDELGSFLHGQTAERLEPRRSDGLLRTLPLAFAFAARLVLPLALTLAARVCDRFFGTLGRDEGGRRVRNGRRKEGRRKNRRSRRWKERRLDVVS